MFMLKFELDRPRKSSKLLIHATTSAALLHISSRKRWLFKEIEKNRVAFVCWRKVHPPLDSNTVVWRACQCSGPCGFNIQPTCGRRRPLMALRAVV